MGDADDDRVKPSEQSGGTTPDEAEIREKGEWSRSAAEGLVPPELGSSVLGETTGSDEPATEEGVDLSGGDHADATSDGGPEVPADAEPAMRDAAAAQREAEKERSA